jgi:hypothetical protein
LAVQFQDLNLWVTFTCQTYAGHIKAVTDLAKVTVSTETVAANNYNLRTVSPFKGYPDGSQICLATRQLYDFLDFSPSQLSSVIGDVFKPYVQTTRCNVLGRTMMSVQSDILSREVKIGSGDLSACPSVDSVHRMLTSASTAFRRMTQYFYGQSSAIFNNGPVANPLDVNAIFFWGADAYISRLLWLKFIEVHVRDIMFDPSITAAQLASGVSNRRCPQNYVVPDPYGFSNTNVSLPRVTEMWNEVNDFLTELNVVPPQRVTLPQLNRTVGIQHLIPLSPVPAHTLLTPGEKVCEDDPGYRFRKVLDMTSMPASTVLTFLSAANNVPVVTPGMNETQASQITQLQASIFCGEPLTALPFKLFDPPLNGTLTGNLTVIFPATCRNTDYCR